MELIEQTTRALEREIRTGARLLEARERAINQQASAQARANKEDVRFRKQRTMQHMASIPMDEFMAFAANPKFRGCWQDKEFMQDYLKRNPHLRSNK
jgi:hypothetical protein|tara:strand:- start:294 stop:584 length:291 start_codon:yes stop_codon:yes gene_type:complete